MIIWTSIQFSFRSSFSERYIELQMKYASTHLAFESTYGLQLKSASAHLCIKSTYGFRLKYASAHLSFKSDGLWILFRRLPPSHVPQHTSFVKY